MHLEFSSDNSSQLIAISDKGFVSSFLMKGFVAPAHLKSNYIDDKKIIMREDKPMLLIPFLNINYAHFMRGPPTGMDSQIYGITSAAFAPAVSIIAF